MTQPGPLQQWVVVAAAAMLLIVFALLAQRHMRALLRWFALQYPGVAGVTIERAAALEEAAANRVVRELRAEIEDPTIGRCRACGARTAKTLHFRRSRRSTTRS